MFLEWTDLVCGYHKDEPLNNPFSGQISTSGIYTIQGPNGSGKSTLLRTWVGLMPALAGKSTLAHCDCEHSNKIFPCIGYVPQNSVVNPYFHISVRNLVKQGLIRLDKKIGKEDLDEVDQLLKIWDISSIADKSFNEISLGQKTRALVARALVSKPNLMFLDEPLASLDTDCQDFLLETLSSLIKNKNMCIIIIDHHIHNFSNNIKARFIFERLHYNNVCTIKYEPNQI